MTRSARHLATTALVLLIAGCQGESVDQTRRAIPDPEPAEAPVPAAIGPKVAPATRPAAPPSEPPATSSAPPVTTTPETRPERQPTTARPVKTKDVPLSATASIRFDLGRMPTYDTAAARVRLVNDTGEAVTLRDCKSDCGCLAANCPKQHRLAPGESVVIDIRMNSGDQPAGRVKPMNFVLAGRPPATVVFELEAVTFVEAAPDSLRPEATTTIALRSIDEVPFRVTGAEPSVALDLAKEAAPACSIEIDWGVWRRSGRPRRIVFDLDHPRCPKVIVDVVMPPPE